MLSFLSTNTPNVDTSTFTLACSLWLLWSKHSNLNTISSALQCCWSVTWSVPHLPRKMTFTTIWRQLRNWRHFHKEHIWASEMLSLSTVSYNHLKASQGWPEGLSLLPKTSKQCWNFWNKKGARSQLPMSPQETGRVKTKNLNQTKNIIFNWSFPKKLSVNKLTMPYFYWVFGNIWC